MTNTTISYLEETKQLVLDTILGQLTNGVIPWQQPWISDEPVPFTIPKNSKTGDKYRGINILLLWAASHHKRYKTQEWATLKQWNDQGEFIRKNENGHLIIKYNETEKEIDGELQKFRYIKRHKVFNRCQLQSYEPKKVVVTTESNFEKLDLIENFLENTGAIYGHAEDGPHYNVEADIITLPWFDNFFDTQTCTAREGYYNAAFHEFTHWTGAEKRLNRDMTLSNYVGEELTAEFGAAFLCAEFGIATLDKGDHAGYIENWLTALRNDKSLLLTAASQASKAVDYLKTLNPI